MAFPANLTNAVDGITDVVADHLNNLEAKVGIDGSLVTTSLDYLLKNPGSIEPGHKHTKLWASAGGAVALQVDASGNVGIGPTGPGKKLDLVATATGDGLRIFGGSAGFAPAVTLGTNYATDSSARNWAMIAEQTAFGNLEFWASNAAQGDPISAGTAKVVFDKNGNVGIGTTSPSALLHLSSITKGFLPPVMTTTQKAAISSPPAGLVVYDSTLNKLCIYTGAAWETITSS